MSFISKNKKGLALGAAIVIGGAILGLLQSPWIRSELTEEAVVLRVHDDGSCEVETEFSNILTVWDCKGHKEGDSVTVKYREATSLGEIISSGG
ncbi:MAG: hypothetical protein KatS3mg003_0974 [Candidatus Nitrosocaldaceae archaeon]|nr:MAG: hypothetical protein KatS3mg003_0974 [Candidatus Nitrosocaldaceae archaeon]